VLAHVPRARPRASLPGADDVHGLDGQALPFRKLAGEEFDARDAFDFFHLNAPSSVAV